MERTESKNMRGTAQLLLPIIGFCFLGWLALHQYEVRHPAALDTISGSNLIEVAQAADNNVCEKSLDRKTLYLGLRGVREALNRFDDKGNDVSYLSRTITMDPVQQNNEGKKFISELMSALRDCPDKVITIGPAPEGYFSAKPR